MSQTNDIIITYSSGTPSYIEGKTKNPAAGSLPLVWNPTSTSPLVISNNPSNYIPSLDTTSVSLAVDGPLNGGQIRLQNAGIQAYDTNGQPGALILQPSQTDLVVKGNTTLDQKLTVNGSFNLLPAGVIVAYNGNTAPSGWALCDGTGNTPDLRGKFIWGSGNTYHVGNTGGSQTVSLSVDQIPDHTHRFFVGGGQGDGYADKNTATVYGGDTGYPITTTTRPKDGWPATTLSGAGSGSSLGASFNIMPPYYVLTYIIKL